AVDNSPAFILGVTAFPLPENWCLNRARAAAFLDFCQRKRLAPRGLCMYWDGIGHFDPRTVPNFAAQMRGLAQDCAARGLRLFLHVAADKRVQNQPPPLATLDDVALFQELASALGGLPSVILGRGNEEPFNGWDSQQPAAKPAGVALFHRGSRGGDVL